MGEKPLWQIQRKHSSNIFQNCSQSTAAVHYRGFVCHNLFLFPLLFPPLFSYCCCWAHMGKLKYSLDNVFQHLNVKFWTACVRGVSKSFSKSGHHSFLASFLWGVLTLTMLRQPVTQYANDTGSWCKPWGWNSSYISRQTVNRTNRNCAICIKLNEEEITWALAYIPYKYLLKYISCSSRCIYGTYWHL